MGAIKISKEDAKWRGRDAARTLAEAERIKSDPQLARLAAREAKNMMKEQMESVKAMSKIVKATNPAKRKK